MAEAFTPGEVNGNVTVEFIENCGVNPQVVPKVYTFFDGNTNRIQGWSHITDPATSGNYGGVKFTPKDKRYYIPEAAFNQPPTNVTVSRDTTCNSLDAYAAILVRKYTDGGSIHLNGIEPRLPEANLTFANLDSIVIEMKIDKQGSNIMTPAQLQTSFGANAANIDKGEFTLWVVGLGVNALNGDPKVGERLHLSMDKYADKWIRVTIKTNGSGGTAKLNQVMMQPVLFGNNVDQGGGGNPIYLFKEMGFKLKNYYLKLK